MGHVSACERRESLIRTRTPVSMPPAYRSSADGFTMLLEANRFGATARRWALRTSGATTFPARDIARLRKRKRRKRDMASRHKEDGSKCAPHKTKTTREKKQKKSKQRSVALIPRLSCLATKLTFPELVLHCTSAAAVRRAALTTVSDNAMLVRSY